MFFLQMIQEAELETKKLVKVAAKFEQLLCNVEN